MKDVVLGTGLLIMWSVMVMGFQICRCTVLAAGRSWNGLEQGSKWLLRGTAYAGIALVAKGYLFP